MNSSKTTPDCRETLIDSYKRVRARTDSLCATLEAEDMVIQSMPDVSPLKWHVAHVTWFFEVMVLMRTERNYEVYHERFTEIFNSYYQAVGSPFSRARRGMLSRPTVVQVQAYRQHVDQAVLEFLSDATGAELAEHGPTMTIGLNHEQQHQELMLMDIKHAFSVNPLAPIYAPAAHTQPVTPTELQWIGFPGGTHEIGHGGNTFSFDNESPRHLARVGEFELASRTVTCGEYLGFIADGGYERPELWLADGWDLVRSGKLKRPEYWSADMDLPQVWTLNGMRPIDPAEPVCHVSYYEADAYATWAGARLPLETEWELASSQRGPNGALLEDGTLHPTAADAPSHPDTPIQMIGGLWEWTSSPYTPYPGYKAFEGDLAEYNGKFMINQLVLRGGCCVTPKSHIRRTYRNFYYPHQRWMFSGIRLAR